MLIRNVCIFIKYETSKYNDKRETFTICKYMLNLLVAVNFILVVDDIGDNDGRCFGLQIKRYRV